ncbi:hypothetical protein CONPUDRAFT_164921 [Coniophora puteana RWD-64-598 SS2]|uniref:Transferrin receptor-like dimerisation domain-containing protein n=1 Tax=Coniophora puteana (strain RWD-64-598) TaxID=741705 RepID=A0A5M3MT04_CONPW|nr:uncharacterized protein CONPUDRAFT_164921 [Coniophora puteana RWD-64-598 SS2]EIW82299.1 hypothetical protein CONPUDRAFT_164921 [Coniophora puteana RWD-64-598 SS2]
MLVAVAKHLGLLSLRLADSIILPLNTTHYANELEVYVDTVEAAAATNDHDLSFATLRRSIVSLQEASAALDSEKASAEKALRKALQKLAHKRLRRRFVRRVIRWIKKHLGLEVDPIGPKDAEPYEHDHLLDHSLKMLSARAGDVERLEKRWGKGPLHDLIQAAKRVRKVNAKLAKFEQGFISEDGIRSRNWYKHLGVAPGRYLGYGATTLPALTEAVIFDRNASLIRLEEDRLIALIDSMAQNLLN